MRLIDADKLKAKAFGGRKGLINTSDLDNAPTVEAIPIEWLETWKKANDFHSRSSSQIVNKIIKDYREEQDNARLQTE